MKHYLIPFLLLTVIIVSVPALAFAQYQEVPGVGDTLLSNGAGGVIDVLDVVTNWMFTILLSLAVIFIILAAYKYLTSGGGEEVGSAHKMIMYAAIAIAVAFLAKGIVFVVQELVTGNSSSGYVGGGGGSNNGTINLQYNGKGFGAGVKIKL